MKLTTAQIAVTAFIIAIFFGIILTGQSILTKLIETPSTQLLAHIIYTVWITCLAIWILAKLLRISRDTHLTDLDFQPHDFEHSSPSNFARHPGRSDTIIKTAQQHAKQARQRRHEQACPVEQNGKQLARKFGPLGETLK